MKTIEEKAKAYDEIIERAKTMLAAGKVMYGKENNASQLITDIIPELRESEDERNVDTIFNCLYQCCDTGFISGMQRDNALAWLEKQKESLHISETCKENADFITNEQRFPDCCLKCNEYEIGYKAGYEHGCTAGYNKAMKEIEQKDQKPVEKQDYSGLTDFERAIHRGFLCAGVENVPVTIIKETAQECMAHLPEWSEEDEKLIRLIISILEDKHPNVFWRSNEMESGVYTEELVDFLKSLRLQPKQGKKGLVLTEEQEK